MSYYTRVYEQAIDNYGLITSSEAKSIGIPNIELVKLARRGRLNHVGFGVYRVEPYVPTHLDKYAEATKLVGEESYIYGESVLSMLNMAFVNPTNITVATPKRNRKKLPQNVSVVVRKADDIEYYEGIRSQSFYDAVLTCKGHVLTERLISAVDDGFRQGLISSEEVKELRSNLGQSKETK